MAIDPLVLDEAKLFGQIGQGTMTGISCRTETSGLSVCITSLVATLVAHFGELAAGCREGQQIAARYHELSKLSGADLAKRGFTRQSIARVALNRQASALGVQP